MARWGERSLRSPRHEAWGACHQLVILALPITFFIAIQRHRLYDIDTIINRALVYGSVTVMLAAVYIGCIVGLLSISQERSCICPAAR